MDLHSGTHFSDHSNLVRGRRIKKYRKRKSKRKKKNRLTVLLATRAKKIHDLSDIK